jgi:hypothetical protein
MIKSINYYPFKNGFLLDKITYFKEEISLYKYIHGVN